MKRTVIFFMLAAALTASAQDPGARPLEDPASAIEKVNAYSQKSNTITADFTQEKEMSFMQETVVSRGRFYFQKEKMLRWEYTEPFEYAIILRNNRIRILDEGKIKDFDAGSNRMFTEIGEIMSGMVNGTLLHSDKFRTRWFESEEQYIVELTPVGTAMQDYLSAIILLLSKKDFSVDGLKMVEKTGDYTRITFHDKKFNETIPASIFNVD